MAETSLADVNKAFVEALIVKCGGDDDAGKTKARTLLGISRSQLASVRANGKLLVQHIDRFLAATRQTPRDWLLYMTALASTVQGMRVAVEEEEAPILKGQRDQRRALLSEGLPAGVDAAQLPLPFVPDGLLVQPKRGRPRKSSDASH